MASTKITVRNDGPLRIEGDFEVADHQGQTFGLAGRTVLSLCRCGHSANKPFCDGAPQGRFRVAKDEQQARELPPPKPQIWNWRSNFPLIFSTSFPRGR